MVKRFLERNYREANMSTDDDEDDDEDARTCA